MALISRLIQHARGTPAAKPLPQERRLPPRFIADVVTARDRIPERVRAANAGYVHVSSLVEFCPRQLVLMRMEGRPLIRSVTGGHRVMWRIGRAVEAHIREQFIESRSAIGVIGEWRCLCEATRHRGLRPEAERRCPQCHSAVHTYGEYTLWDHEGKLVGNPDLIVNWEDASVITEIKSMNKVEWDALTAPKGDHLLQAGLYYDLAPLNGLPRPHKELVFVYCTKDFKYGDPYKEFHVDATTPTLLRERTRLREEARAAVAHEAAGTLPVRTCCQNPQSTMAKKCPVVASCFNRS